MANADVVTPFDDTTGNGPWDLSSVGFATHGGIDVALSTPIGFEIMRRP
jgi:hypothetical protein